MFNPLKSALLSPHSLYVCEEDLSVKAKPDHLYLSGEGRCNSYLHFIVRVKEHFAAVKIEIAPFNLNEYPDQTFYRCIAQTKNCCLEASKADFEAVVYDTSQLVYQASFHQQSWNFSSKHCWRHSGTAGTSTTTEHTCHSSALKHVQDDVSTSLSAEDVQEHTGTRVSEENILVAHTAPNTITTSWKKRTREAVERARCDLKRPRNSSLEAFRDDQTWQEKVLSVATEARQETAKTSALEHIKRLLQIEKQANQMSNYCQYLASCILLIYIKNEDLKRATEVFQSVGLHAKTAKRRIEEAKLVSRIIASFPKSTVTTESISLLFDDNTYAIIRAAVRSRKTGFDTIGSSIAGSLSDSVKSSGLTQPTFDLLLHLRTFFPDHDINEIRDAISFKPYTTIPCSSRTESIGDASASRLSSDKLAICLATQEDKVRLQKEDVNPRTSETTFAFYEQSEITSRVDKSASTSQRSSFSGLKMTYTGEMEPTHDLVPCQPGAALTRAQDHRQHNYDTQAVDSVSADVSLEEHHIEGQGFVSGITPDPSMALQGNNPQIVGCVGLPLPETDTPLQSIPPDYITEWPPITDPFAYDDAIIWPSHVYHDDSSDW